MMHLVQTTCISPASNLFSVPPNDDDGNENRTASPLTSQSLRHSSIPSHQQRTTYDSPNKETEQASIHPTD